MKRTLVVVAVLAVVLGIWAAGCGGGGGVSAVTGAVDGYVYYNQDQNRLNIYASPAEAEPGFVPAPNATVQIDGKQTRTDNRGHYFIGDIMPGTWDVTVTYNGNVAHFQVTITAGHVVHGGGHEQGGG